MEVIQYKAKSTESNKNFKIVEIQKTKPSKILLKINQKLKIGFDPKLH